MENRLLEFTKRKILDCAAEFGRFLEQREGPILASYERDGWVESDGGSLIRGRRNEVVLGLILGEFKDFNRVFYKDVVSAIECDPVFSPYIGGVVGTALSGHGFDADVVIRYCIVSYDKAEKSVRIDLGEVLGKILEVERLFFSRSSLSKLLIPMPGIKIDLPGGRFDLSEKFLLKSFQAMNF